ncbi:hypothetical protein BT63DRAFT_20977 [Microthyrium microscopicum]|uniref:Uncharacterized protein n=1 Tax=Microthyrium microscopicum TaxID=703497 RepID=A0A6A6UTM9_9PEZI|nr:hypothetical protein BT63DRAFT_20977 [Microthyrium microscopicum]
MASPPCPVPLVEDALRPYIRSRQEVLQIRQDISSALQARIGSQISITQLISGSGIPESAESSTSSSTSGLHKQFFDALAAHRAAQAKYEAATTDLKNLRQFSRDNPTAAPSQNGNDVQRYVRSVRQRQQQERMEVVKRALVRLDEMEPHAAKVDVKSAVKEKLGLPPDPPSMAIDQEHISGQIDELSLKLKKTLLQAKSDLATSNQSKQRSQEELDRFGKIPHDVRLAALMKARQELIQWIETELSKVSEDEEEPEDGFEDDHIGHQDSAQEVQFQVQGLYERYVSTRQSLLDDMEMVETGALPDDPITMPKQPSTPAGRSRAGTTQPTLTASELLAVLPTLVQTSRDEASLLQRTAFLRKQANIASSETKQTVQRLAGESHLVPPQTDNIAAWDVAATESTEKTRAFVKEHVKAGLDSIGHAREVLATIQAKRSALEHLKGTL